MKYGIRYFRMPLSFYTGSDDRPVRAGTKRSGKAFCLSASYSTGSYFSDSILPSCTPLTLSRRAVNMIGCSTSVHQKKSSCDHRYVFTEILFDCFFYYSHHILLLRFAMVYSLRISSYCFKIHCNRLYFDLF